MCFIAVFSGVKISKLSKQTIFSEFDFFITPYISAFLPELR